MLGFGEFKNTVVTRERVGLTRFILFRVCKVVIVPFIIRVSSSIKPSFLFFCDVGTKDVNEVHLAYTQRGFLCGAYGEHESLQYIHKKLKSDDLTLKNYESSLEFSKQTTKQFTSNDVYKDGKWFLSRTINSVDPLVVLLALS